MAAINLYPQGGNDYSSFWSGICPVCSKVHHLRSPNAFLCYGAGMPGTAMAPTVVATDLPGATYTSISYNGTVYCAVGPNICATSTDMVTWTSRTIGPGTWEGIAWNASNLYVAVGINCFASSPDGTTWTIRSGPKGYWISVCWAVSIALFVAVVVIVALACYGFFRLGMWLLGIDR